MRTPDLFAKREGPGVSCQKKQKDLHYLCLQKDQPPLSSERSNAYPRTLYKKRGAGGEL
jgi:hypothetical protein